MSRHRNITAKKLSDEYDGFDDVYGHSVEEEYCVSPSEAAFMYDRESSKNKPKIGAFFNTVSESEEENEEANLSDLDKIKLDSCLENITQILGSTHSRADMVNAIITHNYDMEKTLNFLLNEKPTAKHNTEEKVVVVKEVDTASSKAVAPAPKSSTITIGFDILKRESNSVNNPRSQSPSSGRATPIHPTTDIANGNEEGRTFKVRQSQMEIMEDYRKSRGESKQHLYMVVIGHVDAGKSTLMGRLLFDLGQVNQKTMHKYEQESKKLGKQSFMYAWVLDETGEERNRGITMDVGRSQFETKSKLVTLLDAPGHKDFIPNMISGAGQADVALLVVDATRGEFETGFDFGGQTREHALLVRSVGVSQLTVAVNKLDTVNWSKERFDDISQKLRGFLKQAGFKENDVTFVPCSGLTGQNLVATPTENELLAWYDGPCLLEVIDKFKSPERPIAKPFRLSVNDIFKGTGSNFCVSGRVETGRLSIGDRVLVCPNRVAATVKALAIEESPQHIVFAGDQVSVTLSGIDMQNVAVGAIVCDPQNTVQIASRFQARIVIFNVTVPITKGFPVVLHHQNLVEPAVITRLISQLNKSTGEVVKKHPRCLGNNVSALVEIQVSRPIAMELYSDCKELGRVMLRVAGITIAAGLITKIIL